MNRIVGLIIKHALSAIIIMALIGSGWLLAKENEEYKLIDILAYRDPEYSLKVYAQFNVSQEFVVNDGTAVTRLVIPMYVPREAGPVEISLRQEENVLKRWQLGDYHDAGNSEGIYEIDLPLDSSLDWSGKYILTLDGRSIGSDQQDKAPRLFIEKDDGRYPAGNYWIASNKKSGDISLQVFAKRHKWQRYQQTVLDNPPRAIVGGLAYLVGAIILAAAPHALWRG